MTSFEYFRNLFPTGQSVVMMLFQLPEHNFENIRQWEKKDFDYINAILKKCFKEYYEEYPKGRAIIKRLENQAFIYWNELAAKLTNKNTQEFCFKKIDEWHGLTSSGEWGAAKAVILLNQLLKQSEFLTVDSGGVPRQIFNNLESPDNFKNDGKNFPTNEGTVRGGKKENAYNEDYSHQIIPPNIANQYEQRFALLQNSDFLPVEIDERFPVPDFDQYAYEATLNYQSSLSDLDSDLLMYLMAVYIERANHPLDIAEVNINEIMAALGQHFHKGGKDGESYRAEDKRYIRSRIELLQNHSLTSKRVMKNKNIKPKYSQSQILKIDDRTGGQIELSGRIEWNKLRYSFGESLSYRLFQSEYGRPEVAILPIGSLQYHPERELYEKRLSKYLGFGFRLNLKNPKPFKWSVQDILEKAIKAPINDFNKSTALKLEKALHTLAKDNHIKNWQYCNGETEISKADTRLPNNWFESWLKREIEITRSDLITEAYQKIGISPPVIEINDSEPLSQKIKAFKLAYGFTSAQIAKDLNIPKSLLSMIENGQREASKENKNKIRQYILEKEVSNTHFAKPNLGQSVQTGGN